MPIRNVLGNLSLVILEMLAAAVSAPLAGAAPAALTRVPVSVMTRGHGDALHADAEAIRQLRAGATARLTVPLPGGTTADLDLERFEILSDDAVVTATGDDGPHPMTPDLTLYRGRVVGDPDSWVVLGFSRRTVTGLIVSAGERYVLGPVRTPGAAEGLHAIARDADLGPREGGFECDADRLASDLSNERPRPGRNLAPEASTTRLLCRVALDCDYELGADKFAGDIATASQYLLTLMGVVSSVYERDLNVTMNVGYLNLWTTVADPYTQSTTNAQLTQFRSYWNSNRGSVVRDIAHLVSGRALGGGIASIGVLCTLSSAYGLSAIDAVYSYPTQSATWDAYVLAHEMGHNFNSYHTQNCFWQANGYAPPGALLDSCYAAEGSCYTGPVGTLPSDGKGTIMSYCHTLAGTPGGIRMNFHPACITEMRLHAEACLDPTTLQPARNPIATAGPWSASLSWTASSSPAIVRYDVLRSAFTDDPAPALVGSTGGLAFTDSNRLGSYYYKVQAATASALAPFSQQVKVDVCIPRGPTGWSAGTQSRGPVVADFNGDGIQDVAVANNNLSGTVSIMIGHTTAGMADGTWNVPVSYACNTKPVAILAADFDDDGILDLVVANDATPGTLSILHGHGSGGVGNGTFDPPVIDSVGARPAAIAVADFDEDGVLDLAVANLADNAVTILRGAGVNGIGTGAFEARADYPVGVQPVAITTADFDEDGVLDLAVVCRSTGAVFLLRGQGAGGIANGLFQPVGSNPVGSAAVSITTGDFNADGILDLVVARQVANGQAVLLLGQGAGGVGNGTFASGGSFACGPSPYALLACDLNGNGITDLVASNSGTTIASVMLGQGSGTVGDGTFQAPQYFAAGVEALGLASGDFDADGKLDLILATSGLYGMHALLASCGPLLGTALQVLSPNGGESWPVRTERSIQWAKDPGVASVDLEVSRDLGTRWERIASGLTGTSFTWTVTPPATAGATALMRVRDAATSSRADQSGAAFEIGPSALAGAPGGAASVSFALAVLPARFGTLAFRIQLPGATPARLELLDVAGRRLASRDVGALGAGSHTVTLASDGWPAGVYLARLRRADGAALVKKAVVTR